MAPTGLFTHEALGLLTYNQKLRKTVVSTRKGRSFLSQVKEAGIGSFSFFFHCSQGGLHLQMRLSVHGAAGMLAPPGPVGRKEENAGREVI